MVIRYFFKRRDMDVGNDFPSSSTVNFLPNLSLTASYTRKGRKSLPRYGGVWCVGSSRYSQLVSRSSPIDTVPRAGNHPHVAKFIRKSPVRPSVTSTPSASSVSRWRCAPLVPGPREEIVPAAEITLCHGTGGVTSGDRNFKAGDIHGQRLEKRWY